MITYEGDPMYDVKRWLYWHCPVGTNITQRDYENYQPHIPGLMERFTRRVMDAISERLGVLSKLDNSDPKVRKEHWTLIDQQIAYRKRWEYYMAHNM